MKVQNKEEHSDSIWWDAKACWSRGEWLTLAAMCLFRDYTGAAEEAICSGRHPYMSSLYTQFSDHHADVILDGLVGKAEQICTCGRQRVHNFAI